MTASNLIKLVDALVAEHINDPTHEMRVAFRKLPSAHKWLLFTILESGDRPSFFSRREDMEKLELRYDQLCPPKAHQPFTTVLEELSEGFVQIIRYQKVAVGVTWIHPSCQDLTIEELARSAKDRHRFLTHCARDGLEKALSVAGGSEGKRILPLLITDDDWQLLGKRCISLLGSTNDSVTLLCRSLSSLSVLTPPPPAHKLGKLRHVISSLWPGYLRLVEKSQLLSPSSLYFFFEMRRIAKAEQSPPNLPLIWQETVEGVIERMERNEVIEEAAGSLERFCRAANLISVNEPVFWCEDATQTLFNNAISSIVSRAEEEIDSYPDYYDNTVNALEQASKENAELAKRFCELLKLPELDDDVASTFDKANTYFSSRADSLAEEAGELSPSDDDRDEVFDAAAEIEGREVTLARLFEDL